MLNIYNYKIYTNIYISLALRNILLVFASMMRDNSHSVVAEKHYYHVITCSIPSQNFKLGFA